MLDDSIESKFFLRGTPEDLRKILRGTLNIYIFKKQNDQKKAKRDTCVDVSVSPSADETSRSCHQHNRQVFHRSHQSTFIFLLTQFSWLRFFGHEDFDFHARKGVTRLSR